MKNRFSTVIIMALNTALTVIGLLMFGPLQTLNWAAWFVFWLCYWRREVRSDREREELETEIRWLVREDD